ncbi:MAG: toll/interleukin-1 receptor domain-containing protein [Verrucomicrobia bacterium]|nr:toll/interleukin-1 receptor domain-containing protein [Verrucomicrobiota bacterium]
MLVTAASVCFTLHGLIPRDSMLFQDAHWPQLLDWLVDDRSVVPVVGEELSQVIVGGVERSFTQILAEELARELGRPMAPSLEVLNDEARSQNDGAFYRDLRSMHRELLRRVAYSEGRRAAGQPPEPGDLFLNEPLRWLAATVDFPLFVAATTDGLLALAIQLNRGEEDPARVSAPDWNGPGTRLLNSRLKDTNDLPVGWKPPAQRGAGTVVFHLFGRLDSAPECALSDAHRLEIIVACLERKGQTKLLTTGIRDRNVLILGSTLPDCLVATFVRVLKGKGLRDPTMTMETLADGRTKTGRDASLVTFLHEQSSGTCLYQSGDAAAFVGELHQRWLAHPRHGRLGIGEEAGAVLDDSRQRPERCIFLSYASKDVTWARQICEQLTTLQLPVWFDKARLEGGEPWDPQLQIAVAKCRLFLPLISPNSARPGEHYYFREWEWAEKRAEAVRGRPFLFPLIHADVSSEHQDFVKQCCARLVASQGAARVRGPLEQEDLERLKAAYKRAGGAAAF